jgi:hypothetical protein
MNYFAYDEIAEVLGFAYETVPNKPILAGDTGHATTASPEAISGPDEKPAASLGILAAGAPALNLWR